MRVRKRGAGATAAALVCLAATAAGCGSDSGGSSTGSTATGKSAPAGAAKMTAEQLDWAVKFTASKGGKADATKKPFTIGFANQQGGTPSYPNTTIGTEAAVKFINEQLGGIDGRPVKLETCFIQAEEDGQKCGAEFTANKDINLVMMGLAAVGNASLYKTVAGKLPVVVANPSAQADMTTKDVYAFNGGSLSPIAADALLASKVPGAKKSAVMHSSNPIGTYVGQKILKPVLEQLGLKVTLVPIGDTATSPEVVSAIQAGGAASAQVFQMTTLVNQCISAYDALKQQNLTPKVVTTYQCAQPAMYDHLDGKVPAGWVFTAFGDSPRVANLANGRDTYVAAMQANGAKDDATFDGDASLAFSAAMTVARIGNTLGPKLDNATLADAIANYTGELMMTPGKANCGKVSKTFIGICTSVASVTEAGADGVLKADEPIDVAAIIQ
jgi:branched-chain amino acid transport system substrate-binding protein